MVNKKTLEGSNEKQDGLRFRGRRLKITDAEAGQINF